MSNLTPEEQREIESRVAGWPEILQTSLLTLRPIETTDGDTAHAVVVHNPFDVTQYQVLALIPGMEMTIGLTTMTRDSIERVQQDVQGDDSLRDHLETLKRERLALAMRRDPKFAHLLVDACFSDDDPDTDELGRMYQAHYGLTGGGDFNRPLY